MIQGVFIMDLTFVLNWTDYVLIFLVVLVALAVWRVLYR